MIKHNVKALSSELNRLSSERCIVRSLQLKINRQDLTAHNSLGRNQALVCSPPPRYVGGQRLHQYHLSARYHLG